jgi:predicted TIM-barrel fold metal-dependent hydrolase
MRSACSSRPMSVAYNEWAIELFGPRRDRFAPVAVLPVADLAWSVREVQRLAKLGFRSLKIPITVKGRPYNLPEYEPLWRAIEETSLILSLHSFTNDEDLYPVDWGEEYPVAEIISSGALQRHPKLKFVVVECGSGWLAWLLHVLDEQAHKKHMWIRPRLEMLPSEFFRRQGHVTFTDDPVALANLKFTGVDGLLWGSDYPHDEGSFPHSQEVIERTFVGVSEADKRKIVHDNAARLYGFS